MLEDEIMELSYDGALVMPSNYAIMNEEEMRNLEGGAILEVILAVVTLHGAGYGAGAAAGRKVGYMGYTKAEYKKIKWQVRYFMSATFATLGIATMLGFEDGFYSIAKR